MESEFDEDPGGLKPVVLTPVATLPQTGLRVQHLMFAIVLCAFLVWTTMVLGAWMLVFAIMGLAAGAIGLGIILARRGSTQQESLLWALAIASERSLPLAPAALAFAEQFSGSFRAKVQLLAGLLAEGRSLPDALDETPRIFAPDSEVLVRVGWATGTLPRALRLAASSRASRQAAWGSIVSRFVYLVVVQITLQVVIGFIMYFITPKYQAIFNDFGIPLPALTLYTLEIADFFARWAPLMVLLLLAQMLIFVVLPAGLIGLYRLNSPPLDYLFRRRHSALILRSLALTVEGGRPIEAGLATLARAYPSSWVARRLRLVGREVERGGDWVQALGDHGLIRPADEAVLTSAQRADNLVWALDEMADVSERRLGYRFHLLLQMLFPLVILGVGAVVFVMGVAYFSPLVRLIEVLSG